MSLSRRQSQATTVVGGSNNSTAPDRRHVSSTSSIAGSGLRLPSNRKTIYDRNLNRSRNAELSKASFAFLFSEMIIYAQRRVTGIQDLERRLPPRPPPPRPHPLPLPPHHHQLQRHLQRPPAALRILPLLQLIHGPLWRLLFSRSADALEHSISPETPNEYMITDNEPLVNSYISVPREMSVLNCAAYVAGIVEGVCDGCGFEAAVSAHNQGSEMWPQRTVFLIRFGESVMEREKMLERQGVK
ncbi:TRAPP subunit trs31 [Ascosphaera atra]|nr:TRAPP subunit trs31 [Ascosphaera atra]